MQHHHKEIGELLLEMGGKLFDHRHPPRPCCPASPRQRFAMLHRLKDELEMLICLNAKDRPARPAADLGIPYEDDVLG